MNWFVVILVVVEIAIIQGNDIDKKIRADLEIKHKECLIVSKVDPEILEKARAGNIDENNAALVEHIFCLAKLLGVVKDNQLQPNVIKQYYEKQNRASSYEIITTRCKSTKNDNIKLHITQYLKCSYQMAPKGTILM